MKKCILFVFFFTILFQSSSFGMSDKLYNQCLRQSDFKSADGVMTKNWKRLKSLLSEADFKFVLEDQRRWVKNGREKEIDYIKSDYRNFNICSLYAISSYARANLLGEIANFLQNNPNYTQQDIDYFMHQLDYVSMLNNVAQSIEPTASTTTHVKNDNATRPTNDLTDKIIEKAKDVAIEKAVDVGVRWLLKKLIR